MRRPQMERVISNGTIAICAFLLASLGCARDNPRALAERAIRAGGFLRGRLVCETRLGGQLLLTFQDTASGVTFSDIDTSPMVLVDTERMATRLVRRGPPPAGTSSSPQIDLPAPPDVDSLTAVTIAMRLVGPGSRLHCVSSTERAFFVDLLTSGLIPRSGVSGQMVLVPRGGPAHVYGVFQTVSDSETRDRRR